MQPSPHWQALATLPVQRFPVRVLRAHILRAVMVSTTGAVGLRSHVDLGRVALAYMAPVTVVHGDALPTYEGWALPERKRHPEHHYRGMR